MPNASEESVAGKMPAMRPPETMAILSQVCLSSSSSEEIITTVTPDSRLKRRSASSTSAFAPTSMPRVGSETNRNRGSSANAFARQIFCWLPPESYLAFCRDRVHLIISSLMYFWVISWIAFSSRQVIGPIFLRNLF